MYLFNRQNFFRIQYIYVWIYNQRQYKLHLVRYSWMSAVLEMIFHSVNFNP